MASAGHTAARPRWGASMAARFPEGSVNFVVGGDNGEAAGLVLFAPVNPSNGTIGTGILGLTGGVPSSGLATVGAKNGC
jgi:hypothetical protein